MAKMKSPLISSLLVISLLTKMVLSQQQPPQNVFNCGVPQITINEMIVNGYNATRGQWPWHVAIFHKHRTKEEYECGGTLVTKLHVITAAHCLNNRKNENIVVKLGVHQLNSTEDEIQHRAVKKSHKTSPRTGYKDDIAILELETEVEFGRFVQPACVSLTEDLTGQVGTVNGWGLDESNNRSNILKSAQLPVVDFYTCAKSNPGMFGAKLDSGLFCAGYTNGTTVCNGDSGGGLFFKQNDVWYLGGIVSFSGFQNSGRCKQDGYGGFTRIYSYLEWIKSVTKLNLRITSVKGLCKSQSYDPTVNYANDLSRDCGISFTENSNKRSKIDVFEFPWMAILVYKHDYFQNCVGTLINKRYVLTSFFCISLAGTPLHVRLGEHTVGNYTDCNNMRCAPPVKQYGIECIIEHPIAASVYKRNEPPSMDHLLSLYSNNIALIRLDQNVTYEDHIRPICLPVTRSPKSLAPSQYFVTGWDRSSANPSTLLKASVTTDPTGCRNSNPEFSSSNNMLCMVPSKSQIFMSIGSPLGGYSNHYDGNRVVQFGIHFLKLNSDLTIFLDVTKHVGWILANVHP